MRYLLFLALTAPSFAVDLWTPVLPPDPTNPAGYGVCEISAATGNGAAAKVTLVSKTPCGIASNDKIWLQNAQGNRGLNIHMVDANDDEGLCRTVKNLGTGGNSTHQFDLYDCPGTTVVTGTGTYTGGGYVGRVQARTLNSLPSLFFDSTITALLQDTTSAGYAFASRPEYTFLLSSIAANCTSDLSITHDDFAGGCTASYALAWYAEGKPGSSTNRTRMINGLANSQPIPTTACAAGVIDCFVDLASGYSDYAYEVYGPGFIQSLNLGWSELSSGQKTFLRNYYLTDYNWTYGGHDYTASTATFPAYYTKTGTIGYGAPGTTLITGASTQFTTQAAVGRMIMLNGNGNYGRWFKICSITDDTHLDLCNPVDTDLTGSPSGLGYKIADPWVDDGTMVGYLGWSHNNYFTLLCGANLPIHPGCNSVYSGTLAGGPADSGSNHQLGRLVTMIGVYLTLAAEGGDPRALWVATDAVNTFYHLQWPGQTMWGGMSADQSDYHLRRLLTQAVMGAQFIKKAFTDAPDITGGGTMGQQWLDEATKYYLIDRTVDANASWNYMGQTSDSVGIGSPYEFINYTAQMMFWSPLSSWAKALKYYVYTTLSATAANYLYNRPDTVSTQGTNTSMVTTAPLAPYCALQWTDHYSICGTDRRFFLGSRSGTSLSNAWGTGGVNFLYQMWSTRYRDHGGQVHEVGPKLVINGHRMLDGDHNTGLFNSKAHGNIFVVGAESDVLDAVQLTPTNAGRSQLIYAYGSPTVAAQGTNTKDHYSTSASINSVSRSALHIKNTSLPGIIIQRDDFSAGSTKTVKVYNHYHLNACTPGANTNIASLTGCTASLSRSGGTMSWTKGSAARVNTNFYGGTVATENSSDTNCAYTGQAAFTCRVTNELTGTSGSLFEVHQVFNSAGSSMPAIVTTDVDTSKAFEIQASSPFLVVLAPNATVNLTSLSGFTNSTANTQFAATGFAAGTYSVSRNGSPISGCTSIVVVAGEHVIECPDVDAGTISIAVTGSGPAIGGRKQGGKSVSGGKTL